MASRSVLKICMWTLGLKCLGWNIITSPSGSYGHLMATKSISSSPKYHKISWLKATFEHFCALILWNLAHFPPIFLFFIYGTVSGAFLHHVFLADKDYFCNIYNHKSEFWWSVYPVRFHMSLVTFTHWLDFCLSGGGFVVDIYSFFWWGGGDAKERVYRF